MSKILFIVAFLILLPPTANAVVRFGDYTNQEFHPTRGEVFKIPIICERDISLKISIYTVDGEVIRTLKPMKTLKKGSHYIIWDGKDEEGQIVPDESYVPVIQANSGEIKITIDPRITSGGETIDNINLIRNDHQSFSYQLPAAARVSIRAGIKAGPLLKVLADWGPHSAGRNILYWDGYDEDKIINLAATRRQKLVVAAFKLPAYSIITSGNNQITYIEYYKKRGWELKPVNLANVSLQRNDEAISIQYYLPHLMHKSPRVILELLGKFKKSKSGYPVIPGQVSIKVDMDTDSKWSMQESRYEVGFFVDNKFLSEEEQGYVPLTWRWTPNNLKPGIHTLTVNVSGFRGQVGAKSLNFEIPER